jgi:hypothetical protein
MIALDYIAHFDIALYFFNLVAPLVSPTGRIACFSLLEGKITMCKLIILHPLLYSIGNDFSGVLLISCLDDHSVSGIYIKSFS